MAICGEICLQQMVELQSCIELKQHPLHGTERKIEWISFIERRSIRHIQVQGPSVVVGQTIFG